MSNEPVADYYDASTSRFLFVGGSGRSLAMHRPLWTDGIANAEQAAGHINGVIRHLAESILGGAPDRVVDLGCGVGGTMFHLALCWRDTAFVGLTISGAQVRRGAAESQARGLANRCRLVQADFTRPVDAFPANLVIAIESHVHAASLAEFLTAVRRHLEPGGVLLVVDDMLVRPEADLSRTETRWLAAFRKGWRLGHVPDRDGFMASARAVGFDVVEMQDLTPFVRLNRLRDRVLHVVGPVADRIGLNRWPLFGNMIGGDGLTRSYRLGIMGYTLVALRLRGD